MLITILTKSNLKDLVELSTMDDFPYIVSMPEMKDLLGDESTVNIWGAFFNNRLIAIMTSTCCQVFPTEDCPTGRYVILSGAYTHPEYRLHGLAHKLISVITERMVTIYKPDYICCDHTSITLFEHAGFAPIRLEKRLWKRVGEVSNVEQSTV